MGFLLIVKLYKIIQNLNKEEFKQKKSSLNKWDIGE